MKLLVINPNTTQSVTDTVARAARQAASRGTKILAVTGDSGPAIIAGRADNLRAARTCVSLAERHAKGCDAVVLGVSLDTALATLRRRLDIPVLGMTEAGCMVACTIARRFAVLTFGRHMVPLYRELVRSYGFAGRLTTIAALGMHPTVAYADPAGVRGATLKAVRALARQGAGAVILSGAVYAGMSRVLQASSPLPLVDGIHSAVMMAEGLVRLRRI